MCVYVCVWVVCGCTPVHAREYVQLCLCVRGCMRLLSGQLAFLRACVCLRTYVPVSLFRIMRKLECPTPKGLHILQFQL